MASTLQRARREGTPLIDGARITFVWQGPEPPVLRGDFNYWDPDRSPEWQPAGTDLWTIQVTLAEDAYIEYVFGTEEARVYDPFNPRRVSNGMGKYNHFVYLPKGGPTPFAARKRGVSSGVVTRHDVPTQTLIAGRQRQVYLYQPPVSGPVPLMLVYDGRDYYRRASLTTVVDNMIAAGRIQPIALAMVDNGRGARTSEYGCSEGTMIFLQEVVLPLAHEKLNLIDVAEARGAYGVMGASMGGLMSLYTALRLPGMFGKVLSQSGAFYMWGYSTGVIDLVQHMPAPPLRIWMDVGRYERLLEGNRQMHALLQARRYEVTYREYSGGHSYIAWRDDLVQGLEVLFPPDGA